ncbi:MAG: PAS domain S-box protein [Deltaproteobacteria bacterium]|nr:PAS domain S-box protein [Deltaproteobacteria bacterium]
MRPKSFVRLPVLFFILAVLVILLTGSWLYHNQKMHLQISAENELWAIASLKADQIDEWREDLISHAATIANSPLFADTFIKWKADPKPEMIIQIFKRFQIQKRYFTFLNLSLVDPQGRLLVSLDSNKSAIHPEMFKALGQAMKTRQPVITDLHVSADSLIPHIGVVSPINDQTGNNQEPLGAIVIQIEARQFLYPLIRSWPLPSKTAETLIVRKDGDSVLFLNDLRHVKNAALNLRIPLTKTDVPAVMAVLGKKGIFSGNDYRGVPVLSAIMAIPDSPWFMVAKVDKNEVFATWRIHSYLIMALVLILIAASAGVAGMTWQRNRKKYYKELFTAHKALSESEDRYRATLLGVGDAVMATDALGMITVLNPTAEALTGYSLEEAKGRPLTDVFRIVNEETRNTVESPVDKVIREGQVVNLANHTLLIAKDGTERPIADSGAPIRDEDGNLIGVVLVFRDQSAEREAERRLRESEARFRNIVEKTNEGVWTTDAHFVTTFVNPAMTRMMGFTLEEMMGKSVESFIFPEDMADHRERMENRRNGQEDHYERRFRRKDGKELWAIVSATARLDEKGVFAGSFAMFTDITQRRIIEDSLKESERFARATLDGLSGGIAILDQHGRIEAVNESWRKFARENDGIPQKVCEGANYLEVCENAQNRDYEGAGQFAQGIRKVLSGDLIEYSQEYPCHSVREQRWFIGRVTRFPGQGQARAVVSHENITTRKQAEEALRQKSAVDSALAEIAAGLLKTDALIENVAFTILRHARFLTQSPHGFVGSINTATGELCIHTISAMMGNDNHPARQDKQLVFPIGPDGKYAGLWGEALNTRKPFFTNAPSEHPASKGVPPGHIALKNFLTVPVIVENNLLGQISLTNSPRDYTAEDLEAIRRIAELYGMFLRDQQAKKNLERSEEQLRQAQKMEAIGQLAGGVAHDFNNMLQVILGNTGFALEEAGPGTPLSESLFEIKNAANRSRELTKQLLAFARKQTIAPKVLDLNETVEKLLKMLRRLLGEDIDLLWRPAQKLGKVKMDPSQLDQLLANLLVNAKDAIGGVGKVTIETKNVHFNEDHCALNPGSAPGYYVMLAVSDNGCGMEKDILAKIFEPFYTTKEVGKGTGLGLSMVYGIVKQNNGFINVYSEPGESTTFKIYMPLHEAFEADEDQAIAPKEATGGDEVLLLVEDEGALLRLVKKLLEKLGYTVLSATSPEMALQLASAHAGPIHLLITDVVMPEMSGRDLLGKFNQLRPGVKCLYMSGYTANAIAHHGILDEGVHFLQKPFSVDEIAKKVRAVLDC